MTSSRAKPNAPVDDLSDYDVILVMQDIYPFFSYGTASRFFAIEVRGYRGCTYPHVLDVLDQGIVTYIQSIQRSSLSTPRQ